MQGLNILSIYGMATSRFFFHDSQGFHTIPSDDPQHFLIDHHILHMQRDIPLICNSYAMSGTQKS